MKNTRVQAGWKWIAACVFSLYWAGCTSEVPQKPISPVETQPETFANPFIGTGGHGHTTPAASRPFGMVQLGPDTRLDGWDGCGGYHYSDSVIIGFSHTHLSGTGVSDYGDIEITPYTWLMGGFLPGNPVKSPPSQLIFSHNDERAEPGYYAVKAVEKGSNKQIEIQLTATERTGIHQYLFLNNEGKESNKINDGIAIQFPLRDKVTAGRIKWVTPTRIEGYRHSTAWAVDQRLWFAIEFSKPIVSIFFVDPENPQTRKQPEVVGDSIVGQTLFAFASFKHEDNKPIQLKVGISSVDQAGARQNLETEAPHWDFEKYKAEATAAWHAELSKIKISAPDEIKTNFYSALYHTFFQPNLFSDVDGRFRGMDQQIHQADNTRVYTVFSLWDTFRAAHPLYTLVQKERANEFIRTFLYDYQYGGRLPVWELAANETECMIGYHSVSVIADAFLKGINEFDANQALEAMIHSAEMKHFGLEDYQTYGYIRGDQEAESVSKTLEYAYDDWCIAMMARKLGKEDVYDRFIQRAQNWKNVFDESIGFMRARMNGLPFAPFEASEVNFHYTEANAWQYSLFVPQDISGLMKYMGGPQKLEAHLDSMFSASTQTSGRDQADITGLIGQYAHGNEPSHHMAYLYNFCGKPWKTQQRIRQILAEQYHPTPDGLSGNEDCGQMSAWYVLSSMGFYPVTPGSGYYVIGSPCIDQAEIDLGGGKKFIVTAKNQSAENIYIHSVTLNGKDWPKSYLPHDSIAKGGEIVFVMGAKPNKKWGVDPKNLPVTAITAFPKLPVPTIIAPSRTFKDSLEIGLKLPSAVEGRIYFTTDGTEPTIQGRVYTSRFKIGESTTVKAMAYRPDWGKTPVITADFHKINPNISIALQSPYAQQYNGGGQNALIDELRGGNDFRTGNWQGFREDFAAVVDLGEEKAISQLGLGCLQDAGSWIFMPKSVTFEVSSDGKNFRNVGTVANQVSDKLEGTQLQDFTLEMNGKARYIKVTATQYGKLPEWHLGAGGDSWIFVDEVLVKE